MTAIAVFFIGLSVGWYALRAEYLLHQSQPPTRLQRLLGYIFLWWGLSTLKDLLLYLPGTNMPAMLDHVFFIDGCGAVTFALILMELTMPRWVTLRRTLLLSLPFAVFLAAHFFISASWLRTAFTVFFVTFAWSCMIVAVVKGRDYARSIRQAYSNLEDVDISSVWTIILVFTICQHIWWFVADSYSPLADSIYYASSLLCWQLTLRGVNRLRPVRLPAAESPSAATVQEQPVPKPAIATLATRLASLMDDEPLYLNKDLTLTDLVERLGTNRTYLSDCFVRELNTTFYDYINRLRIERKVLPMMQSSNAYTLEYIADQAGFKSISTFRRAFKKLTGKLPSEYAQNSTEQ